MGFSYEHFHFVIKTSIKLLGLYFYLFIYLFNFYETLIISFLSRFLFFFWRKLVCNCYHKF